MYMLFLHVPLCLKSWDFVFITDAPKTPSVTVSPSGEIEEGSSVTLSCSSDANPAATYTWFRDTRAYPSREMKEGQQLFFSHILSSESGQYRCEATNKWGKDSVTYFINVNRE